MSDKKSQSWTVDQQIEEAWRRFGVFDYPDKLLPYTPRSSDVICAVPFKHGTTWLLHICHQIRMQGAEPDFEDQFKVVTWLDSSAIKMFGIDHVTQPQPAEPHIFMSHLPYAGIPSGGRKIHCYRDPKDALVSHYHFLDSFLSFNGRVSLDVFAQVDIQRGAVSIYLVDLLEWWEHRHDPDVLFLFYDDLKEDHIGCVRRIAKFMGVDCSEEVIMRVVHTTTHAEMLRHSSKFDLHSVVHNIAKRFREGNEEDNTMVGRVRKGGGKSGEGQLLPPDIKEHIDQKWEETVTAKLGFKSLNEMRLYWKKELNHKK